MRATINALAAVALVACTGTASPPRQNPLLAGVEAPAADVQAGCQIARVKCTRCHTVDRLLRAQVGSPRGWRRYVGRMRRMPGAAIGAADEPRIVRCLVYRSFGAEGLTQLEEESK